MSKIYQSPIEDEQFDENEPSIERCPHDKENPFAQISRALIRDNSLSPECRHMLIYLLSMDDKKWKINPKQLVAYYKPHWGRDKIYEWIDEAIEAGYMKKETVPNLKHPNLKGKIKYYISESPRFKKCFRHTEMQDTEAGDPDKTYYKNNNHSSSKEESLIKESSSKEKESDDDLIFNDFQKEELNNYTAEQIEEAMFRTNANCLSRDNRARVKYFFTTIRNLREAAKKTKTTPFEEVSSRFKKGELYNLAEFNMDEDRLSFTRGMKHEFIDFKYFSWDKFQKLCENFGIEFKR